MPATTMTRSGKGGRPEGPTAGADERTSMNRSPLLSRKSRRAVIAMVIVAIIVIPLSYGIGQALR